MTSAWTTRPLPVLAAAALLLGVAACGGERSFDADEFVEAANREDAGLALGEQLVSEQEGVDVFALSFAEAGAGAPSRDAQATHGGGSLMVTQDAEAARAEYERCEDAVSLTCYRAANVVLLFEGDPADPVIARVDGAIRALASD